MSWKRYKDTNTQLVRYLSVCGRYVIYLLRSGQFANAGAVVTTSEAASFSVVQRTFATWTRS